ncbi:MAG: glycosyltransferase family 1 protein [Proteobacteria bacterium]|nr:MAG: glycosyltransferase family 1 protein [Pseudomonadota bacterium]
MVYRFPNNPSGRLNLRDFVVFAEHRSGWAYCIAAIGALHNDRGVLLDDFVEKRFSWDYENNLVEGVIPYREPWVGIFHNPPDMPEWYHAFDSPQQLLERPAMRESLTHCRGIFVLSEYHKRWLEPRIDAPVESLVHPTQVSNREFSPERFEQNPERAIIQVGVWLRSLTRIAELKVDTIRKVWLVPNELALRYHAMECERLGLDPDRLRLESDVEELAWVDDSDYDELLSKNIVFASLFDSSANNLIVECIARNTPILVNPLPAVVEYLGEHYPFYFSTMDEASFKAGSIEHIRLAHDYLKSMDKRRFTGVAYRAAVMASSIYQSLPLPSGSDEPEGNIPEKFRRPNCSSVDVMMRHVREQLRNHSVLRKDPKDFDLSVEDRILEKFRQEWQREN